MEEVHARTHVSLQLSVNLKSTSPRAGFTQGKTVLLPILCHTLCLYEALHVCCTRTPRFTVCTSAFGSSLLSSCLVYTLLLSLPLLANFHSDYEWLIFISHSSSSGVSVKCICHWAHTSCYIHALLSPPNLTQQSETIMTSLLLVSCTDLDSSSTPTIA